MATRKPLSPAASSDQELQSRLLELRAAVARQRAARSASAELRTNPAEVVKPSSAETRRIESLIGQLDHLKAEKSESLHSSHDGDTQHSSLEGSFRPSELLESSISPNSEIRATTSKDSSGPDEQELADFQAILRAAAGH